MSEELDEQAQKVVGEVSEVAEVAEVESQLSNKWKVEVKPSLTTVWALHRETDEQEARDLYASRVGIATVGGKVRLVDPDGVVVEQEIGT